MQRLFTMFPLGWPGIGLLMIRLAVALPLVIEGLCRRPAVFGWMQVTALLLSVALAVGYLTPIVTAMALLLHGLFWFRLGFGHSTMAIIIVLDTLALILLGPGGYSLDACQFGRRLIVLPRK